MSAVNWLLAGPRGRRSLLEYALLAEEDSAVDVEHSFRSAVFLASYRLDVDQGAGVVMFGPGAEEARQTVVTAEDVADRLSRVPLPEVTAGVLRSVLAAAVDHAMYWQPPNGEDVLAATASVRGELERIAEHVASTPHAQWWSVPPTRSSTRSLFDGTPAALWFVEDGMGWKRAVSRRMRVPSGVRAYEIDGPQAWAQLCREFPVEVTAQKRHDWYRATGRAGRWVVPDWPRVAEQYDGIHLTVRGYLSSAGTAITVDDATASVIAGWAPDETYWLTDTAAANGDKAQGWVCDTDGKHPEWTAHRAR